MTLADVYVRLLATGRHHRPGDPLLGRATRCPDDRLEDPQARPHDVLVVGAGGAGLRAAIEAQAAGADVGLVCKSLLGKAHTVMAEGGVAAALAHVAPSDSWQTHFRDTMVGGKLPQQPTDGRSSTRWRRPTGSASSSNGARSSTGRPTGGSSSGRSGGTRIRASRTSATGPGSR